MPIEIFIASFAGGTAPSFVQLAKFLGASEMPQMMFYPTILIFGILGALVAWVSRETDRKKAFLLGVAAPAFIATAGQQLDDVVARHPTNAGVVDVAMPAPAHTWLDLFERPAHAQSASAATSALAPSPPTPGASGRTLLVEVPLQMTPFDLRFVDQLSSVDPAHVKPVTFSKLRGTDARGTFPVPISAKFVSLVDDSGIETPFVSLPDSESKVLFHVDLVRPAFSGVLQALGMEKAARKLVRVHVRMAAVPAN